MQPTQHTVTREMRTCSNISRFQEVGASSPFDCSLKFNLGEIWNILTFGLLKTRPLLLLTFQCDYFMGEHSMELTGMWTVVSLT